MARPRKDSVSQVMPIKSGSFEIYARLNGKRLRERFRDRRAAEARRLEIQQLLQLPEDRTQALRMTRLTDAQIRDAEAAVKRAGERSLVACVEASDRVMVAGDPVLLPTALNEWLAEQTKFKLYQRTMDNNESRAKAFTVWLAGKGVTTVQAVTPDQIEDFVYRGERADFTRKNDAAVLQAWANFWKRRRWIKESPFQINFKELKNRARPTELPRVLTPTQARTLIRSANARDGARGAAYVALATWCFLRHAEVMRVSPDDLRIEGEHPVVEIRPRKRGTVSYRAVTVPACVLPILIKAKAEAKKAKAETVANWGRVRFLSIRAAAGLADLAPPKNKKRNVSSAIWQPNILRHTGISYFYQESKNVGETARQAGNSSDVAFRHYVRLPGEGDCQKFYAKLKLQ